MTHLGKRLVSSAFLIAGSIYTIFFAPIWLFILAAEFLVLFAAYEFFALAQRKDLGASSVLGLIFTALIPVAAYYKADVPVLAAACLLLFVFNFRRRYLHRALTGTAVTVFCLIYIAWFFSHIIDLRLAPQGSWWVFYVVLTVKGGDAGAYFTGKRFGRTKLLEHVSPNKSVEGAVGGFVTTMALSLLSKVYLPAVPWHHFFVLGILGGIVSQLGDLAESLLKRDAGIKDSGQIPGLGGIFDVLDSLLPTVPLIYYYVVTFVY